MMVLLGSATSQTTPPFTCPDNSNGFYPLPDCDHTCCRFDYHCQYIKPRFVKLYRFIICSSYYACKQGTAYLTVSETPDYISFFKIYQQHFLFRTAPLLAMFSIQTLLLASILWYKITI